MIDVVSVSESKTAILKTRLIDVVDLLERDGVRLKAMSQLRQVNTIAQAFFQFSRRWQ